MPAASAGTNGASEYAAATGSGFTLGIDRDIGQMLMSHVTGLTASPQLLSRVKSGHVGAVILYGENIANNNQLRRLTSSLQDAARAGGNPPLLIGTDQEGGSVRRLLDAPPTMSAQEMGESRNPLIVAEEQGRSTGSYLRDVGINADFAPVSDIPTTTDNFLGSRAFGYTQRTVVEGASGFAQGLSETAVAGTAKHFPGLGDAGPRNTDLEAVSIGASKAELRASYAPYKAMARLGPMVAPLVMISNAIYPNLDPSGLPADLSRTIVRGELADADMADRVTITDDLEVPVIRLFADAPVKAVLAGDDILMFAEHESGSEQAYDEIRAAVDDHTIAQSVVETAAERVVRLKESLVTG
jgi:beta-N-acetylhexosaminidase